MINCKAPVTNDKLASLPYNTRSIIHKLKLMPPFETEERRLHKHQIPKWEDDHQAKSYAVILYTL